MSVSTYVEIAHQRQVVGVLDIRNLEILNRDSVLVQNEIEFLAGRASGVRRQALDIGAGQARRAHEQVDLVLSPECIEITGDDDRFLGYLDQIEVTRVPEFEDKFLKYMHSTHAEIPAAIEQRWKMTEENDKNLFLGSPNRSSL